MNIVVDLLLSVTHEETGKIRREETKLLWAEKPVLEGTEQYRLPARIYP
jgi:hypothetical protein